MPAESAAPAAIPVESRHDSVTRVESVDALRGLVITLMIFVNDAAGVMEAPGWLKHAHGNEDAMTLPDIVFPCFLFIAGVSIPLAVERARANGTSNGRLWLKILGRVGALLTMGVLMVNMEEHEPWARGAWGALAYAGMLAAFAVVPREPSALRTVIRVARWIGAAALVALALAYTDGEGRHLGLGPLFDATDTHWLRHSWWGILGLIGWAYFMAGTLYLLIGRRREWLVGATGLLMLLYLASHGDMAARLAHREWLRGVRSILAPLIAVVSAIDAHVSWGDALGSLAAITMAGCCLGSVLVPQSDVQLPRARLRWAGGFAAGLLLAAVLLDPLYGLSKIHGTPSWGFLCAAIATTGWMALYWSMDLRGHRGWTGLVRPAGANPLLAYVLHPFLYALAGLAGVALDFYHNPSWPLLARIGGSFLMALFVVQLTGLMARRGFRIQA